MTRVNDLGPWQVGSKVPAGEFLTLPDLARLWSFRLFPSGIMVFTRGKSARME